jgi:hypothetical protein
MALVSAAVGAWVGRSAPWYPWVDVLVSSIERDEMPVVVVSIFAPVDSAVPDVLGSSVCVVGAVVLVDVAVGVSAPPST